MLTSEIETEAVLRNVVTAIASALRPSPMVACPVLRTTLLPGSVPLPGALRCPCLLLLPRDGLLLGTLGVLLLLRLLGSLLLWLLNGPCLLLLRLLLLRLSALRLLLLRLLLLRLLGPLLLRLWSGFCLLLLRLLLLRLSALRLLLLRLLLLRLGLWSGFCLLLRRLLLRRLSALCLLRRRLLGGLGPLSLRLLGGLRVLLLRLLLLLCRRSLLLFRRLALVFLLVASLRVRRDHRPEKQKQGSGTNSSNELHSNCLRKGCYWMCTQVTSRPSLCSTTVASYFLVSSTTYSVAGWAGASTTSVTGADTRSVGLSVVP